MIDVTIQLQGSPLTQIIIYIYMKMLNYAVDRLSQSIHHYITRTIANIILNQDVSILMTF